MNCPQGRLYLPRDSAAYKILFALWESDETLKEACARLDINIHTAHDALKDLRKRARLEFGLKRVTLVCLVRLTCDPEFSPESLITPK